MQNNLPPKFFNILPNGFINYGDFGIFKNNLYAFYELNKTPTWSGWVRTNYINKKIYQRDFLFELNSLYALFPSIDGLIIEKIINSKIDSLGIDFAIGVFDKTTSMTSFYSHLRLGNSKLMKILEVGFLNFKSINVKIIGDFLSFNLIFN